MKNLFNPLFFKILPGAFLLLMFSNCSRDQQPRYEDYNPEDFLMVPGIVVKRAKTPIIGPWWNDYHIYYAYNLDSDNVLVGKAMDVNIAVDEGDGIYILVHKNEANVSFPAGLRILPSHKQIIEIYLEKSKENGVKYYGVDEQ